VLFIGERLGVNVLVELLLEAELPQVEVDVLGEIEQHIVRLLLVLLAGAEVERTINIENLLEVVGFHYYLASLY
jgi:hypothetical protein